jgi:hypothetical protein
MDDTVWGRDVVVPPLPPPDRWGMMRPGTPPTDDPVVVILPCSICFLSIGFQIRRRALVNQFFSCFLSIPVFCMSIIWSCGVG